MRYVVMGRRSEIDEWRRERRIPVADVVAVSTRSADALRGISLGLGDWEVVTLPSWAQASQRVRDDAERNLEICRATVLRGSQAS